MDERTIEQAKLGGRSAQSELLRSLQDGWYRLAISLLGDREMAQDAVQEAALRFLKSLPGFRGESQLRTWSFGIVINVAREMRRKNRDASQVDELRQAAARRVGQGAEQSAIMSEAAQNIRAAMQDLPERQREALILRFFEDLSVEETAKAMNCAQGTVKSTVHQALRALKTKFGVTI